MSGKSIVHQSTNIAIDIKMYKKILLFLSLFFLFSCDNSGDKNELNEDMIKNSINEKISASCVHSSLPQGREDISFNTEWRHFDEFFNEWTTEYQNDVVSVRKNGMYNRELKQMSILVSLGLFSIKNNYLNDGYFSNGAGSADFYTEGFDRRLDNKREFTFRAPGRQFKLTNKGKQYFSHSLSSETDSRINFCVGYMKVKNIISYTKDTPEQPHQLYVTFIADVTNIPDWINNEDIKKGFPSIQNRINEMNGSKGEAYIDIAKGNKGFTVYGNVSLTPPSRNVPQ